MGWMAWTLPTAIFCSAVFAMLAVMAVLEKAWPTVLRKGFLPIETTRGDRLFIGLLTSGFIHLFWLAATEELSLVWASAISVVWMALLLRWG